MSPHPSPSLIILPTRLAANPHPISDTRIRQNRNGEILMTGVASKQQQIATTIAFGLLGAGLVYLGRRARPGILASLATTAGYGMVTRAVSTTVLAVLDPSGS